MIRRPMVAPDGSPRWVLISQIEHARLSAELAQSWRAELFEGLEPRAEFLAAIAHHDDGWADWEQAPEVDPASGRPVDFTEMRLEAALEIWRGSITAAARFGPLAASMVSGHFAALLARSSTAWREADEAKRRRAQTFLDEQHERRRAWIATWEKEGDGRSRDLADRALAWLQFFDALSLWLCCAERSQPQEFATPAGSFRFTPLERAIAVAPCPLAAGELELQARGRSIPAQPYRDQAALQKLGGETVRLDWRLRCLAEPFRAP